MTRDDLIMRLTSKVPQLVDRRDDLPRHGTKKWARRFVLPADEQGQGSESAIQGLVIHQSAGVGSAEGVNAYHIGPNHISATGCPRACYTFIIDPGGKVNLMNDLEDITWSQGGHANPIPGTRANTNFLAICVIGDFDGPTYRGKARGPTEAQLTALNRLLPALADLLGLDSTQTFGHYHFGKDNCPGKRLQKLVEDRRATGLRLPRSDRDWQQMLVDLGYNLGAYGPNKDGVDGDWGTASKLALLAFQRSNRALDTGMRDLMTAVELAHEHSRWLAAGAPAGQCVPCPGGSPDCQAHPIQTG